MEIDVKCYPCLLNQALKLSGLSKLDHSQTKDLMNATMKILINSGPEFTAPHVAAAMQEYLAGKYSPDKKFDPYSELKAATNRIAISYFRHLSSMAESSQSPLETAVKIAAAGNIIDFGAKGINQVDIDHEIAEIDNIGFGIYDFDKFKEKLHSAAEILYIGDNAGEIVFDKVLVNRLKNINKTAHITFATRGKAVLNDITIEDAEFTGMTEIADVISSGSRYPGTFLSETSDEFKKVYRNADLIIAKGQGNFETLSEEYSEKLFFIMRVKCEMVARRAGADEGKLVLMQNVKNRV